MSDQFDKQYIVFLGSDKTAKRLAIKTLCNQEKLHQTTLINKAKKTVELSKIRPVEFGTITFDSGQKVILLCVDDIEQFQTLNSHWVKGGIGVIVLVDHEWQQSIQNLTSTLDEYNQFLTQKSLAIGVLTSNEAPSLDITPYNKCLEESGINAAVLEIDCGRYQDISLVLQSMLVESLYGVVCA